MTATNLVIFDCDGVLVDSERLAGRILRDLFNELGGSVTTETVIKVFKGKTLAQHVTLAQEHFGLALPADFNEIYHRRLFAAFETDLQPIPGIVDFLEKLTIPYCVASNSGRERVELALKSTQLKPYFGDRIFTIEDVQHGKPAPDIFLLAAKTMQVDPSDSVVVEDSPTGVAAGIAGGMRVFGFADLTPAETLTAAGATVFTRMSDLLPLIGII